MKTTVTKITETTTSYGPVNPLQSQTPVITQNVPLGKPIAGEGATFSEYPMTSSVNRPK